MSTLRERVVENLNVRRQKILNGQYTYMRALKYFIWKDEKKVGQDGKKYIEEVSDLASYIENANQEDGLSNTWTLTLI